MTNVKSESKFQSSGPKYQEVDIRAELEATPIAVRGGNSRVN